MHSPSPAHYRGECASSGVVSAGLAARLPNAVWGGSGNDLVHDAVVADPDFYYWYGAVDAMEPDPVGVIERLRADGVRGLVVEPGLATQVLHIDDHAIDPVYDACQSSGLPLLLMGGGETGPDLGYSNPLRHEQVAMRFPELPIVYVHGGWPFVQEALGVAFRRRNVWMMPDVYFPGLPGEADYLLAMRTYLQDRFLFASNHPYCPISQIVERYQSFGLTDEVYAKVMHDNAARLFGLGSA